MTAISGASIALINPQNGSRGDAASQPNRDRSEDFDQQLASFGSDKTQGARQGFSAETQDTNSSADARTAAQSPSQSMSALLAAAGADGSAQAASGTSASAGNQGEAATPEGWAALLAALGGGNAAATSGAAGSSLPGANALPQPETPAAALALQAATASGEAASEAPKQSASAAQLASAETSLASKADAAPPGAERTPLRGAAKTDAARAGSPVANAKRAAADDDTDADTTTDASATTALLAGAILSPQLGGQTPSFASSNKGSMPSDESKGSIPGNDALAARQGNRIAVADRVNPDKDLSTASAKDAGSHEGTASTAGLAANTVSMDVSSVHAETHFAPIQQLSPADQIAGLISSAMTPTAQESTASGGDSSVSQTQSVVSAPAQTTPSLVKTLSLSLEPADLGTVTVKMRLTGSGLGLQIETAKSDTASMLDKDKSDLSEKLQAMGYAVDTVVVKASASQGSDLNLSNNQAGSGQGNTPGGDQSASGPSQNGGRNANGQAQDGRSASGSRQADGFDPSARSSSSGDGLYL